MSQSKTTESRVRVRWLGRVPYVEAWDLQQRLHAGSDNHLLLLEHPPIYTIGRSGSDSNILISAEETDADVLRVNRGGDVTFHGPGQVVGYPILDVGGRRGGGMADTAAYVASVENYLIGVLDDLGVVARRIQRYPGVWLDVGGPNPRKIAAIGVRLTRGRSMHGFALNVDVDLDRFARIVPCGITEYGVTSLAAEGIDATMEDVVGLLAERAPCLLGDGSASVEFAGEVFRRSEQDLSAFSRGLGPGVPISPARAPDRPSSPSTAGSGTAVPVRLGRRLAEAGVDLDNDIGWRKPSWMRVKLQTGDNYRRLKQTSRALSLTTVCEEAGCPNIFECWNEGTATFMLLGERCTRACGFCLVDTRRPETVDTGEPRRVAEAVRDLGIDFAVLTMVARDDLADGGAGIVARTVDEIRRHAPGVGVEVLISDLAGSAGSLRTVAESKPDILNHNIETVARLQRAVRPSASYARSMTLLARGADHGLVIKSGLIVGMGETFDEVVATLADLAAVGVRIVTIGQYLRPTSHHLPIARWWEPDEFAELKRIGENEIGIEHVESSPLTRSSHHAGSVAQDLEPDGSTLVKLGDKSGSESRADPSRLR
ncbi:MAG: lipoyl synthase [Acidimicrobiia bacterium]|nr:lipoyl synthase [Acidimicrobiia bacterium]